MVHTTYTKYEPQLDSLCTATAQSWESPFSRFPNLGSRQKANRDPNDWQITHSSPAQCPLSCMLSPAIRPPKNTPAITLFLFGKPLRRQKDAPPSPCGDSRTTQRTKLFSGRPRPRARSCQTFSLGIRVRFFLPPWRRCARLPRQGSFARRRADRTRLTQRRGVSKRQAGANNDLRVCVRACAPSECCGLFCLTEELSI